MDILVVEDETDIASFIKRGLEEEGYRVDIALDGEDGVDKAKKTSYNLIVMAMMLPKKDGLTAIRELRDENISTPILCLADRDTPNDVVAGLNAGCDAYLRKPFAFAEFVARTRALIRRDNLNREAVLKFADIHLNPISRKAWRNGQKLKLTAREYALLEYFMRNPNQVLSRSIIAENAWDCAYDSLTNIIDVYVNYLRNKVDSPFDKKLIHTVRGVGYVLGAPFGSNYDTRR